MSAELNDIVAGFTAAIFLLPIIFAVEWQSESVLAWFFTVVLTCFFFGSLFIFVLAIFGVLDGIFQPFPNSTRIISVRYTILIGLFLGAALANYVLKPIIYKIYRSLD